MQELWGFLARWTLHLLISLCLPCGRTVASETDTTRLAGSFALNSNQIIRQHIFCPSCRASNVVQTFVRNLDVVRVRFRSLSFVVFENVRCTRAIGNERVCNPVSKKLFQNSDYVFNGLDSFAAQLSVCDVQFSHSKVVLRVFEDYIISFITLC